MYVRSEYLMKCIKSIYSYVHIISSTFVTVVEYSSLLLYVIILPLLSQLFVYLLYRGI